MDHLSKCWRKNLLLTSVQISPVESSLQGTPIRCLLQNCFVRVYIDCVQGPSVKCKSARQQIQMSCWGERWQHSLLVPDGVCGTIDVVELADTMC